MSEIYHTEPPTSGKVVIGTSFGDIDVELWCKECPKACRNFIQLAMEQYYDNTIFHRVIKDFMVQGGDPTGSGSGGSSIYSNPADFPDETHSRIKFNHRGQVAVANAGPGTNGSQFFVTLGKAPWLDGKHTIFGRVTGATVFNVLRMGELPTGEGDRPSDPPRITGVRVMTHPFADLAPRDIVHPHQAGAVTAAQAAAAAKEAAARATRRKMQAKKNSAVLSFAADDSEEEGWVQPPPKRGRTGGVLSLHDALAANKGQAPAPAPAPAPAAAAASPTPSPASVESPPPAAAAAKQATAADAAAAPAPPSTKRSKAEVDAEIAALEADVAARKAELSGAEPKRGAYKTTGGVAGAASADADASLVTPLQARRAAFLKQKRARADREASTLQRLKAFENSLFAAVAAPDSDESPTPQQGHAGGGDAAVLGGARAGDALSGDSGSESDNDMGFMRTKLVLQRHIDDGLRGMGGGGSSKADAAPSDGLLTYDPLDPQHKGKGPPKPVADGMAFEFETTAESMLQPRGGAEPAAGATEAPRSRAAAAGAGQQGGRRRSRWGN